MPKRQWTLIALEEDRKRTLVWRKGGELIGDDDLKIRFQQAWDARDQEAFRLSLPKQIRAHFRVELAGEILHGLCAETLDLVRGWASTPEELQRTADDWNARGERLEPFTAEEIGRLEEERQSSDHNRPPYSCEEIEPLLDVPAGADGPPPEDSPKCLECFRPMEWIWFVSDPVTWEMLCGRAGWTPVCRQCKSWRACRVIMMN